MSLGMIFPLDALIGMLDEEKSSRIFPEYEKKGGDFFQ